MTPTNLYGPSVRHKTTRRCVYAEMPLSRGMSHLETIHLPMSARTPAAICTFAWQSLLLTSPGRDPKFARSIHFTRLPTVHTLPHITHISVHISPARPVIVSCLFSFELVKEIKEKRSEAGKRAGTVTRGLNRVSSRDRRCLLLETSVSIRLHIVMCQSTSSMSPGIMSCAVGPMTGSMRLTS